MTTYKNISRRKWRATMLLLLLIVGFAGSASAQVPIMYDGTIYTKLDLQKAIISQPGAAKHAKLSNGEYDAEPWDAVGGGVGGNEYSYLNLDLGYPALGKVMLRYDTYKDHAPTVIEILGTMNPDQRENWHSIVSRRLTNQENTSHKEILDLNPALHNGQMYRYLQIRVHETSTPGDPIFKLAELDILAESDKGTQYNLNDKLGSSNRNGNGLGNLYDNDNTNIWQVNWAYDGVVPGEYSNIKVDLGEPTTGYVMFNYTTREMQAPKVIAFYGYNGDDWNDKYNDLDETPLDINTKWEPLYYAVDPTYTDNQDTPWNPNDLEGQMQNDIHDFRDVNQNNTSHHVVIGIPEDTPYRYIMMRVYEGTGNPGSPFNGHIGSTSGGSGPFDDDENVIPEDMRDRSELGYMFNFDLRTLEVYKVSSIPNKEKLLNMEFIPTHGVVDPLNKVAWGYADTNISETTWTDEGTWGDLTFNDIADRYGISKPDFNRQGENGQLQAAHEKEYDLYVIPGETVTLIPYSDIAEETAVNLAYYDGYIRWYDYNTGKVLPDANFGYEFNPVLAWQTEDGLFGSSTVINRLRSIAGVNQDINRRSRYRAAFTQFHAPAEKEFQPFKVAADFTTAVGGDDDDWREKTANMIREGGEGENVQIVEPAVTFRAVFNIKDGREFAKKLTEENPQYIDEKRKVVSAPSGSIFRIRLDFPEPQEEGVPSDIYYIKGYQADGTPIYDRVYKFMVVTDGENNGMFYTDNGRHSREKNNVIEEEVHLPRMGFVSEQTGKEFNRFLKCDYQNATPGKHIVRIFGCDKEGNVIRPSGREPLQIMEYEVTFERTGVDVSMQSMADYLLNLDADPSNDVLYHHTSQSLRNRFGEPYSKQDFDQYVGLEFSIPKEDLEKYFTKKNVDYDGKRFVSEMGRAVAYPIAWDRADYAFSYSTKAGWNVYDILNHSEMASYCAGAGKINGRGLFDVSFYFNHPDLYGDKYDGKKYEEKEKNEALSINNPQFNYIAHTYNDAGYFFYVDAAADPGRIYRSEINKPCPGTRIHVSAWVSEFGDSGAVAMEKQENAPDGTGNWANVIFHFREQLSDGTINTLYSYVPGKVPAYGDWFHIYFSFSPDVADMSQDPNAKYYVVLESNCPSSWGADYAVDDIEIFIQKPDVSLMQFAPICKTKDEQGVGQLRLLVECPYDILVGAAGLTENENANIYFSTINKEKYDAALAQDPEAATDAFEKSIVPVKHKDGSKHRFGSMTFHVDYDKLPEFKTDDSEDCIAMKFVNEYNEKCIRFFITIPDDASLEIGSNIIFCLVADAKSVDGEISSAELIDLLNIGDDCSIQTDLRLQGASIIKIDGVVASNQYDITVCENQRPVVQLIMQQKDENGNVVESDVADQYYDWFDGTYAEFVGIGLEDALAGFRYHYPDAETYDMPVKTEQPGFSEENKALLKAYCDAEGENGGRLHLNQSFYVFPQYKLEKEEESRTVYVTAKPIDKNLDPNVLLCMNPVEVPLTIRNTAPVMLHGLGMNYPESMLDVPLRVGLRQIQGAQTNIQSENFDNAKSLWLPVRKVAPVTESVTNLVLSDVEKAPYVRMPDQYIYLVGSNDPNYQSLTPNEGDNDGDDNNVFNGLLEVGRILEIKAARMENYTYENSVRVVFDENFKPREGYYYMIRYSFQEDQNQVSDNEYIGEEAPCYGEDLFTIKIVPEYQVWIGGKDADYNNDNNWRRVSLDKLLAANNNGLDGLVIDEAVNNNIKSYVPMDFTKVIVPDAKNLTAQGYIAENSEVDIDAESIEMEAGDGRVLALENVGYGASEQLKVLGGYTLPNSDLAGFNQPESAYPGDIKYDMAAYLDNAGNVQCKLWYHNTCEQIHFNFGAEMLGQGELKYERAWLDLDNKPANWYFLSLPLKDVYAGEFYLPSADAVDKSQLFTPVYYRTQIHDRFRPAVYQRGWNKGVAKIFEPNTQGNYHNAAAQTTTEWSRVYNDVLERYDMDSNPGFSVRTDLSFMNGNTDDIDKVRFRLPKADARWSYRDMGNDTDGYRGEIPNINGSIVNNAQNNPERVVADAFPYHKLNGSFGQMNATVERASEYFLVGNPFICHLDLEKFFDINSNDIEAQCWVLNDGQLLSIVPEMFAAERKWQYLPPFQGFFVKSKNGAKNNLELSFTKEMMEAVMSDNIMTLGNRPVPTVDNSLLITMSAPGERDSHIRILLGERNADAPALFNADSQQGMTAYGVSDGLATSVKYVDEIKKEEVGVSVRGEAEVKIRFNGDCLDGLLLHDNLTGDVTELYDGMEYTVNGSTDGRLYITSGIEDAAMALEDFRVEVEAGKVAVIAPGEVETLLLQVFDTEGRLICNELSNSNRVEASLASGIYILKAVTDAGCNFTAKVSL